MADKEIEEIEYSDEELSQIGDLLAPLKESPDQKTFSPLGDQFQQDMEELKPPPEPVEEEFPSLDDLEGVEPEPDFPDTPTKTPPTDESFLGDISDDAGFGEPPADIPDPLADLTPPGEDLGGDLDMGGLTGADDSLPDLNPGDAGAPPPDFDLDSLGDDLGGQPTDDMGLDSLGDDLGLGGLGDDLGGQPTDDMGLDGLGDDLGGQPTDDMGLDGLGDDLGGQPTDDLGLGGLGDDLLGGQPDDMGLGGLGDDLGGQPDDMGLGGLGDDLGGQPDDLGLGGLGDDLGGQPDDLGLGGLGDDLGGQPTDDLGLGGLGDDLGGQPDDMGLGGLGDDLGGQPDDMGLGGLGGDTSAEPSLEDAAGALDGDLGLGDMGEDPAGDMTLDDSGGDLGLGGGGLDDSLGLGDLESATADSLGGDLDLGGDFDSGPDMDLSGLGTLDSLDPTSDLSLDDGQLSTTAEPVGEGDFGGDFGGDLSGDLLDSSDLGDMAEQAKMASGIGDEYTEEDLANIRVHLNDYSPGIKKNVIDVIVNEKITQPDQRLLMKMVIDQVDSDQIADFLEQRLGYRPDTSPAQVTKDGVQIIYADGMSPEDLAKKRKRTQFMLLGAAAAVLLMLGLVGGYKLNEHWSIQGTYDDGLERLALAAKTSDKSSRDLFKKQADDKFASALSSANGKYDVNYLNKYGRAYQKAGYMDAAFVKLFGKVKNIYGENITGKVYRPSAWNTPGRRAPIIRLEPGSTWKDSRQIGKDIIPEGHGSILTDRQKIPREVLIPGAYIVDRLRDNEFNKETLISLARFHSQKTRSFKATRFKNNGLGIDYYRLILKNMDQPDDVEALSGIGDIHYNAKEYAAAARQYNTLIDKHPSGIEGHAGLLNTYMEMWSANNEQDPRYVVAVHRQIRQKGLEEDLPIYIKTKLAGFYINLDEDDLRIKYQIDPKDLLSGLNIRDNALNLLEMIFRDKEERDAEIIKGSQYGEAFYQRGRFLIARKESTRALKQFQNAHKYDKRNYLAVNAMGEYYKKQLDYGKAQAYFTKALEIHNKFEKQYGSRPEDETLEKGDIGKIHFNLGSLQFLRNAGVPGSSREGFPDTRIYPRRALPETKEMLERRNALEKAREKLLEARATNLQDPRARIQNTFWIGWIDYINGNFTTALKSWGSLDTIFRNNFADPVLLMGRGNAYFYTEQYRAALGNYLKVKSDYERKSQAINRPDPSKAAHQEVFYTLSAVYNNIGAVYEQEYLEELRKPNPISKTLGELERNALLNYWNAIQTARKVEYDNEIARTNQQLAFAHKRRPNGQADKGDHKPLIDDWVSPILSTLQNNTDSGLIPSAASAR